MPCRVLAQRGISVYSQHHHASSSDDDSSDDDEDETAALMAELTKIKRERQEEKERQEREAAEANAVDREAEIALGNPLLNLQAALGRSPSTSSSVAGSSVTGSFAVKRRWDDDLIFKNQAAGVDEKPKKEFVNDLLRTEFHRESGRVPVSVTVTVTVRILRETR